MSPVAVTADLRAPGRKKLTTSFRGGFWARSVSCTLTASLVHPREVFRPALREAAAALILVHNHPSGDPTPSSEDREVTSRLAKAGEILGVRVLDHVIVAESGYCSLRDEGAFPG